ncbi:xanthine dehydrogenase [Altererythrobacter sp. B11]|uniref:xanthine dehydrogenase family protein molybdopterin-binding subunit n=1 Tax=Altererythrobacter sp. B11 TaxID=2060312 RepID=UPI000DC73E7E|nr:molybdopterin cofactor-binding domain-containing protein [Altererythrobacter sp. B11]BBC71920.1 xanthine dehydrogenase [Altererythrobacter sp. B11]
MRVSRRAVMAGAAAGGGLFAAWWLMPRSYPAPLTPEEGEAAFGAWLKIDPAGVVTVAVPELEMGQGVTTLLPQIVAMELGADWRQVAVAPAPVSAAYANYPLAAKWAPLWQPAIPPLEDSPDDLLLRRWAERNRFMATADGMSLPAYELPCREAAAAARAMLCMAAADEWGVAWEECDTQAGFVTHGDQRLSFAALAQAAGGYTPPDPPPLRTEPPADPSRALPGDADLRELPFPRLDLPAKVDGSMLFAGDIRLPDMAFAAIRHGPVDHSELTGFDRAAAAGHRGLLGVVRGKRWLAAVGETWWAAERALDAMAPLFRVHALADSTKIEEALDAAVRRGTPQRVALRGDGDAGMERPDFALRYDVMPAAHGTIETASCTARLSGGRLELWLAAQAPERARAAAAAALGMAVEDVVLYPMPAGGSFDARLEHDHAIEAALIAREAGRPVQLIWSRWQEQLMERPRPPVSAVLSAKLGPEGRIQTFRARLAVPPAAREFGRRQFGNLTSWAAMEAVEGEADPMALEGMMPPYAIANVAVDHVPVRLPLPSGRLRANAHGYTCFMVESFIDEVALRAGQEPLSYRIGLLGEDLRLAQCLQRAARLGEWGGGEAGSGQGIACHRMGARPDESGGSGRIALIATAAAGEGGVRVRRLSAAVDIGRVINRDIALQQIEGGLLFGVGLALGSAMEYEKGLPRQARLSALDLPTLADSPEIRVELIESDAEPFDPGEIGVAPVAPAIANALFSATGLRLRRLPLLSGGL